MFIIDRRKEEKVIEEKRIITMSAKQRKKVRALIKSECCNYTGGNCLLLDNGCEHRCPQCEGNHVFCKWFINAVLPLDELLVAELFSAKETKRCVVCGCAFVPKSNRNKYCSDCVIIVRRRQKALSERKRRTKMDN